MGNICCGCSRRRCTDVAGILITGASGQVGGELVALLKRANWAGEVHAPSRSELNLADAESIRAAVRAMRPRWIVNPGAYTAVDKAETEPDTAHAVNAIAPGVLGEEAKALGAAVIHFSTDYVFSGEGLEAWAEDAPTGPLGVYGASKLAGEQTLRDSGAAHLIFRTSWVYGATGKNFLRTVLRVAREREQMRIVADQHGAPTWSRDLARMTAEVMRQFTRTAGPEDAAPELAGPALAEAVAPLNGVYHAANAGETTWLGFAQEALQVARLAEPEARFAELLPISTAEYPAVARRPANSRLNCGKLLRTFGLHLQPWQAALADVMSELAPTPAAGR